jgi:hypothetical protein
MRPETRSTLAAGRSAPVILIPQEREKHLLFLVENQQKQIPRSARDDVVGAFSSVC